MDNLISASRPDLIIIIPNCGLNISADHAVQFKENVNRVEYLNLTKTNEAWRWR